MSGPLADTRQDGVPLATAGLVDIVDVLLDALTALAEAGRPDQENRLAGTAYADLRRPDPAQAQRINVLMHSTRLASTKQPTKGTHADHRSSARRPQRAARPPPRVDLEHYEALGAGTSFVLVNDHDPKPLEYQFAAEYPEQFTWGYLEQGPTVWRVRIGKPPEADA